MTETYTHPHNTDQASAKNEAAPSAAKRTLGKHASASSTVNAAAV